MQKIDGRKIAQCIIDELKKHSVPKRFLAVFVVDPNAATESFMKQKEKIAKELEIDFRIYRYDNKITNDELRAEVKKVAHAQRCGGAIIQLPLPEHLNPLYVANVLPPEKDIDLLGERMRGAFYNGRSAILPPAVGAVVEILKSTNVDESSLETVCVVGQGFLIGKPVTHYFLQKVPRVIALDKRDDLSLLGGADLVVCGAGASGTIQDAMVKKGAGVIDFGYEMDAQGIVRGDFDDSGVKNASWYTPTPGGTGPVLVAILFENFYRVTSAREQNL